MTQYTNIQVSESSPVEPVTLDEVKDWVVVDHDDHDALLTSMIKGARQSVENYCSLSLVAKDITLDLEVTGENQKTIPMPYATGLSAVTVDELDDNDEVTTLASGTDYYLRGNLLRIGAGRYSVSYTTVPGTIPEDLKEAIKMEVANRYAHRGENAHDLVNVAQGLSEAAKAKAQPYVITWL